MMAHPAPPGERASQQYAPHPGALSGETFPMSMADITNELLRGGTKRSRHGSLIHSSAYDNRAEASAGAHALVHATQANPPQPPYAAVSAPRSSPPLEGVRAPPSAALASPPIGYGEPARTQSYQAFATESSRAQPPPPLRLPMSPFMTDDYELPRVVLTPPPDEEDGPVTLYPRASPVNDYPGHGQQPRSASLPMLSNAAGSPAPPPPQPVMGFAKPTPPFGRRYSSQVAAVVMPKKPEQVINDIERKVVNTGGRFDAEWNELIEELPSAPAQAYGGVPFPAAMDAHAPKIGSPLPFPTRPAPPPPSQQFPQHHQHQHQHQHQQQQQSRSASAPVRSVPEPARPETPKSPKSPKTKKGKSLPKEPSTPTESVPPKAHRRRSLSLSALFSRKKKPNVDDLPPMPNMPMRPKTPDTPTTPKSATSEKRKTLLKRASLKDLFGTSNSEKKALRKSQSKPELHAGNRLVADDAPPVPSLPSIGLDFTGQQQNKQVVPDALAALTANAKPAAPGPPILPMPTDSSATPAVEMVPDVFAAFNSSQTSLQLQGLSAQLNGISAPSSPQRDQSPFANFEHSTEFAVSQQQAQAQAQQQAQAQASYRARQAKDGQSTLRAQTTEPKRAPSPMAAPIQHIKQDSNEDSKARRRTKSLSKRLSISALFSKKKKDGEPAPAMPTMPTGYIRTTQQFQSQQSPPRQQQVPPRLNGIPKSASAQDVTPPPAVSPMLMGNGASDKARPVSVKPQQRTNTTARVPVPRMDNLGERSVSPAPVAAADIDKPVPAPPPVTEQRELPSSTVRKVPDPSISKQAALPSAIATANARLNGTAPAPVSSPPSISAKLEGPKDDATQKRQSRREQSIVPSSSSEYLKQQKEAIATHQQAQQALVQQFRSVSEPIPAAGPPRSASEQSFQQASNPFAEQAPSAEVIQQAAALVRKPAPMQVVQKAEAAYIHQRKEQSEKVEKLDEKAIPSTWATFDEEEPTRTAPFEIMNTSSLNICSKNKTAPLRIEKKVGAKVQSLSSTPVEQNTSATAPIVAAVAAAGVAGATVSAISTAGLTAGLTADEAPLSSPPEYTETPSFSFPPKTKDTLITPPTRKIRRVSVPVLQRESLISPHDSIPTMVPQAGNPFVDSAPRVARAPVAPAVNLTASPDLSVANSKLEAVPKGAPVINIITATPARAPAQSHEGAYESESVDLRDIDVVSPVPSEMSPVVIETAVRTSMLCMSPPILTSTADLAQTANDSEVPSAVSPSDSDYSLPTLESSPSMPMLAETYPLTSQVGTPTDESFGHSASGTPTRSSGIPAILLAGGATVAAAATATTAMVSEPERRVETDSEDDMTSVEAHLAYLAGSSVDTHETSEGAGVQTPVAPKVNTFLTLAPVTDEGMKTPIATDNHSLDTPVAGVKAADKVVVESPVAAEPPFVSIPLDGELAGEESNSHDTVRAVAVADEDRSRSESVPVPDTNGLPMMPGGLSQTLPTRLSVSPVAEAEGFGVRRAAQRTSIFAMAASAASTVKSAVSSAFAEASDALDEIDAKIEQTVRSASPNVAAIGLPATNAAPTATVVQTGSGSGSRRQDSGFSRRRGSSSDDAASIYTTPMTDLDVDYFDSPSASTTSFETASSNATISPETSTALLPSYSNKARPPSMAKFDDLPDEFIIPRAPQRRGSVPVALAASAMRLRNVSAPLPGSDSDELPSVPPIPAALGITVRSLSRQGVRSATMPSSPREVSDGQAVLTPPILTASNSDGHGSEESSSFHLDTDTIHDSPNEDFASLPDSPLGLHMPGNASSMYVVPYSPEMDELMAMSGGEARTQTSAKYSMSSGAREHVRRTSVGIRNTIASMGFTRGASDEVTEAQKTVRSSQPQRVVPEARTSVVVDYSVPSSSRSSGPVGLGMWVHSTEEVEEIDDSRNGYPFRRRIDDPDLSLDTASYSSSGSDDHEGSPRTPRTPDLDALVQPAVHPNMVSLGMSRPGSPSPSSEPMKAGSTVGTITRTRAPFRAMHYDMSADDVETMTTQPSQVPAS